jgi:hypothetical protein
MHPATYWWRGCLRVMLGFTPLLAVAIPVHAQSVPGGLGCPTGSGTSSCVDTDPPGLADTAEPGSVLVFPKFGQGTVTVDNGAVEPRTQIEIGAVCPAPASPSFPGASQSPLTCTSANYEVEVHWVCPGITVGQETSVCEENGFQVFVSTYGKVVFNPNGAPSTITQNRRITGFPVLNGTLPVPQAPCQRGYAIAYVVDDALNPLAANVLIGDAVQRNNLATAPNNDLQSYSALAIQAVNGSDGSLIAPGADPDGPTGSPNPSLPFDGQPNHYQMVTGQLWGDVRYNQDTPPGPFADTALILLTLDVRSNLPNDATFVTLDFYNQTEIGGSSFWQFDCWDQVQLSGPAGSKFIDTNLNSVAMGTPTGVFVSGQAFNVRTGGYRTLLGLVQTSEGPTGGVAAGTRSYTVRPSNNSIPVPTYFVY